MKKLRWLIINILWWVVAWFALIGEVVGAQRLLLFLINLTFVGALFMVFDWSSAIKKAKKQNTQRPIWKWLWMLEGFLAIVVLIWFGWWWSACATFMTLSIVYAHNKEVYSW